MKKLSMILLMIMVVYANANATIRRVGFTATTQLVDGLDYLNFQIAHDQSADGDTIQLYPGANGPVYTGIISKKLVIIGPGYFTNSYYATTATEIVNPQLQNLPGYISSCSFTIDIGSSGSIIEGLNNVTITTSSLSPEERSNITVRRCNNPKIIFNNSGLCNNWRISQCFDLSVVQLAPSNTFTGNRSISNLKIDNSVLISDGLTLSTSPTGTYSNDSVINCVFKTSAALSLSGAPLLVQNCIFQGQTFTAVTNAVFIKNITTLAATSNPIFTNTGGSNNQANANLASIFQGYPITTANQNSFSQDARFILTTTNIAKNTGQIPGTTTATDCGIFGGNNPYRLSGIPAIPVYIKLDAPNVIVQNGASTYTLTFSIKSNN
jgi:hypothetical protein